MTKIDSAFYNIGRLDSLADQNTFIHRLDPRAKVITTLVFIIMVVSFDKYEIAPLLPFFFYPVLLLAVGNLPTSFFLKKLVMVAPFVFFVAIFNPLLDRQVLIQLGPLAITGGWISFLSVILRFILTVGAAFILIASTGFTAVCMALEKMGTPRIMAVQLLLLYRYLFVLGRETIRMARAHSLRAFGRKMRLSIFRQLVGTLLLRTLDRAQRIHMAMLCRGFDGKIRTMQQGHFGRAEIFYTLGGCTIFILLRSYNLPQLLGKLLLSWS